MSDIDTNWRNPSHNTLRKEVIRQILTYLLRKYVDPSLSIRERVARTSKKLEARLYFTAPSLEYHINPSTLVHRLQRVANDVINSRGSRQEVPELLRLSAAPEVADVTNSYFGALPPSECLPAINPVASDIVIVTDRLNATNLSNAGQ